MTIRINNGIISVAGSRGREAQPHAASVKEAAVAQVARATQSVEAATTTLRGASSAPARGEKITSYDKAKAVAHDLAARIRESGDTDAHGHLNNAVNGRETVLS